MIAGLGELVLSAVEGGGGDGAGGGFGMGEWLGTSRHGLKVTVKGGGEGGDFRRCGPEEEKEKGGGRRKWGGRKSNGEVLWGGKVETRGKEKANTRVIESVLGGRRSGPMRPRRRPEKGERGAKGN